MAPRLLGFAVESVEKRGEVTGDGAPARIRDRTKIDEYLLEREHLRTMTKRAAPLAPGLYERVIDQRLEVHLGSLIGLDVERGKIDEGEAHKVLSVHLQKVVERALRGMKPAKQIELVNSLLTVAAEKAPKKLQKGEEELQPKLLLSLQRRAPLGRSGGGGSLSRPGIPLAESALLVNAKRERRIGAELNREITSADRIDLLCSFLKVSGFNTISAELKKFTGRGGTLRVLTTTYVGATERRAVEKLMEIGAEVRISYDTRRSPLHAKAWIFHRDSGFSTAYIGSSNLSARALTEGLEWNVRASSVDTHQILAKAIATFEGYWASPDFQAYSAAERERLRLALQSARVGDAPRDEPEIAYFDLKPYTFQEEVLEALALERRDYDRHRNLVVAATGTGKTMIAAFDYARMPRSKGRRPTLLFVAHRDSIIRQSRAVFRQVLRDRDFGELMVGADRPTEGRHVFATIQSLNNVDLEALRREQYEVVIVDEFHHAAAATYDRLLAHLRPEELLGLTATPERADGRSVLHHFDGRMAHEIRLWDAISRGLLSPFHYFGVRDRVDLDHLAATKGRYRVRDLENVYTGDDARVRSILGALEERLEDPRKIRALGFCVSVEHARFMAKSFSQRNLPAAAVTARSSPEERRSALKRLERREINIIFAVDLFNEGVDIPYLDTILLLRPTESAPLFLQQLGRGLRLHRDKECLTIFDFIGRQNRTFRFDRHLGALANVGRRELEHVVADGFPVLPAGCSITLDAEAQEVVLENLKRNAVPDLGRLGREVRELAARLDGTPTLTQTLIELEIEPEQIYRDERCYSDLLVKAELLDRPAAFDKDAVKALGRLLHIDDLPRLDRLRRCVEAHCVRSPARDGQGAVDAVTTALLAGDGGPRKVPSILQSLSGDADLRRELGQLAEHLGREARRTPRPEPALPAGALLSLHCRYFMSEVLAALNVTTAKGTLLTRVTRGSVLSGEFVLIFITLQKSEKDYSPSTMYEDYAIDRRHIHWQSPNDMSPTTRAGKVHIGDGSSAVPLIFIRVKRQEKGRPRPAYYFLGAAKCLEHRGERPISITWRLATELPAALFERFCLCNE